MKLVIQIPCLNEAATLPTTLAALPRALPGFEAVAWLVIDDGSTDATSAVAHAHGVAHVVRLPTNRGLAHAFKAGLDAALHLGADVIVNTDADGQYPADAIPALVAPILRGEADMVIGDRRAGELAHFSPLKRVLQRAGSAVVRYASGTTVPDAPSGFRALSREAALRLNIFTGYTYTLETIIQAGKKQLVVAHVPIRAHATARPSRLVRSVPRYVLRSAWTILRMVLLYEPLKTFALLAAVPLALGVGLWARYGLLLLTGAATRGSNVPSVVAGGVLLVLGVLLFAIGLLGDLLSVSRQLQEETLYHLRRASLAAPPAPDADDAA